MRVIIIESHSVYEAFQRYGLGDGDCPCVQVVMDRVLAALEELGYAAERMGGIHNQAIRGLVHRQSGKAIDLTTVAQKQGIDLEEGPDAVRQALLAAGLQELVEALDRLDQQETAHSDQGDLPSYVLIRRRRQGDIVDVHPFPRASDAAQFALDQMQLGVNLDVLIPRSRPVAGFRYYQVMHNEEAVELARA